MVLLLFVVALAGGAAVAWWQGWLQGWLPWLATAHEVRTVVVRSSEGPRRERTLLNASGYVTARRDATVSSKVTGKVVEVLVEEGMRVEAGDVLARIDSANVETNLHLAQARLEAMKAELGETRASLEQARRELDRLQRAAESLAATPLELERAETQVSLYSARLERQEAEIAVGERQVQVWLQELDDTVIRAPFAGVVTAKNAQPGEMISPMSVGGFTRTGICTIVDMTSLEIEVDVSETSINRVEPGQPVVATLDSYPDWEIPASVIAIIPTADRQKATVRVRIAFDTLDPRILPDMGVKVAFRGGAEEGGSADVVRVPASAVTRKNGRDVVWVVRDGTVERRAVTVGAVVDDGSGEIELVAGVRSGERVVVEAPDGLADGDSVREVQP